MRDLQPAVGAPDDTEAARDAGDAVRYSSASADDQRRPRPGAPALASDLPAGALLDVPVVERLLAPSREHRSEHVVLILDDGRTGLRSGHRRRRERERGE